MTKVTAAPKPPAAVNQAVKETTASKVMIVMILFWFLI